LAALSGSLLGTSAAIALAQQPDIVTGEVVHLERGKLIVVRSAGGDTTYTLSPTVVVPADVAVGKGVIIEFEPGTGAHQIRSLTTTSAAISPGTTAETVIQDTQTEDVGTRTILTGTEPTVTGTVQTYVPGESVTVLDSKGSRFTYVLAPGARVPRYVIRGKKVTVFAAKGQTRATYVIEKEGDEIKIRAKAKD